MEVRQNTIAVIRDVFLGPRHEHIYMVFGKKVLRGYLAVTEKCKISERIALGTS